MSEIFKTRKLGDLRLKLSFQLRTIQSTNTIHSFLILKLFLKISVLRRSQEMLQIFPENTINVIHKRSKSLKELISLSMLSESMKENKCSFEYRMLA